MATCHFRHVEAQEKPSKRSKKGGAKGSVAILMETKHLGSVSQDSYPRKSVLREPGILGSNHTVKFSKSTRYQTKFLERRGSIARNYPKCELHERSLCAPTFEERSQEETLLQERCAHREAWDLAKLFTSSRMGRKQHRRPLRKDQRNENSWLIPEHQCTC